MKRFWDDAAAVPGTSGWQVLLDGKPVRLPGGTKLAVPMRAVAEAVASEWRTAGGAKGGDISYGDVPLTRIAGTAQERIAPDPEPVVLELARYAESDLLCYRAQTPPALAALQARDWQPWLDWAESRYGARLLVTDGLMHVSQPPQALAALAAAVAAQPPLALAALGIVVPALGSLVLGLAVADAELDAAAAHALACLDETFQASMWGHDDEAEARRARIAGDIATACRMLALLRPGDA
jgi:chaperone required for assembly of F1-ATPase